MTEKIDTLNIYPEAAAFYHVRGGLFSHVGCAYHKECFKDDIN